MLILSRDTNVGVFVGYEDIHRLCTKCWSYVSNYIESAAERTPRFGRVIVSGWGGRTVVGSASSNSGVCTVFSVHHGVVGRTSCLYC